MIMTLKPYLKYVYEVIAIVVGITISFMVDEWREERQNREELVVALKLINKELISDSTSLVGYLDIYHEAYEVLGKPNNNTYQSIWLNTVFMRTIEFKTLGFSQ